MSLGEDLQFLMCARADMIEESVAWGLTIFGH